MRYVKILLLVLIVCNGSYLSAHLTSYSVLIDVETGEVALLNACRDIASVDIPQDKKTERQLKREQRQDERQQKKDEKQHKKQHKADTVNTISDSINQESAIQQEVPVREEPKTDTLLTASEDTLVSIAFIENRDNEEVVDETQETDAELLHPAAQDTVVNETAVGTEDIHPQEPAIKFAFWKIMLLSVVFACILLSIMIACARKVVVKCWLIANFEFAFFFVFLIMSLLTAVVLRGAVVIAIAMFVCPFAVFALPLKQAGIGLARYILLVSFGLYAGIELGYATMIGFFIPLAVCSVVGLWLAIIAYKNMDEVVSLRMLYRNSRVSMFELSWKYAIDRFCSIASACMLYIILYGIIIFILIDMPLVL